MSLKPCVSVPAALSGRVAAGLSLVGVAAAAPIVPSAVSSAPSSADAAPAPPSISDVPVPFVFRPVDSSDGRYGVRRSSVPTASTPDPQRVPVARQLPSIAVTPLPVNAQSDEPATSDTEADDSAAEAAD